MNHPQKSDGKEARAFRPDSTARISHQSRVIAVTGQLISTAPDPPCCLSHALCRTKSHDPELPKSQTYALLEKESEIPQDLLGDVQ